MLREASGDEEMARADYLEAAKLLSKFDSPGSMPVYAPLLVGRDPEMLASKV